MCCFTALHRLHQRAPPHSHSLCMPGTAHPAAQEPSRDSRPRPLSLLLLLAAHEIQRSLVGGCCWGLHWLPVYVPYQVQVVVCVRVACTQVPARQERHRCAHHVLLLKQSHREGGQRGGITLRQQTLSTCGWDHPLHLAVANRSKHLGWPSTAATAPKPSPPCTSAVLKRSW